MDTKVRVIVHLRDILGFLKLTKLIIRINYGIVEDSVEILIEKNFDIKI